MGAGSWKVYNKTINKLMEGTISLPGAYRMALVTSASNFATDTLSLWGDVDNEVGSGNGYASSGKGLSGESWTVSSGATQTYRFDHTDPVWTATGGTIPNIKGAVIFASGASAGACHLLCYASLTSSQFTLGSGSTLTVQQPATGVFVVYRS